MKLVGWIKAKESDKAQLQSEFEVKGPMVYNQEKGVFENCVLENLVDARKLFLEWPHFWLGAFTPVEDGTAPPPVQDHADFKRNA